MKVAIIGAGVSGLSCAWELEKNGIQPVIFEKMHRTGDKLGYSSLWSRLIFRSWSDPLQYLKKKYHFSISPLYPLEKITMYGPTTQMISRGSHGYIFKRGNEPYSLENQIADKIKSPITYNSFVDIDQIKSDFDHIVVATGSPQFAEKMKVWNYTFAAHTRTAYILGKFDTTAAALWLNNDYANKSFCYLIPNNPKEASLVMVVNDTTHDELDNYWKNFLLAEHFENIILETRDSEHFCGFVHPLKLGRMYFVGNTGGFTDNLVGFGGVNAIESGILAARDIMGQVDYMTAVLPIYKHLQALHEIRKLMNTFTNEDMDRFISFLNTPLIKQLIYNNPFYKMHYGKVLAKALNTMRR